MSGQNVMFEEDENDFLYKHERLYSSFNSNSNDIVSMNETTQ